MPATPADAKGLLKSAIRDDNPVVFIEGEMLYNTKGEVPEGEHVVPLGQADIKRSGGDVTIVCHSKTVSLALKAAEQLAGEGIEAEVVDLRTIRPLDTETVLELGRADPPLRGGGRGLALRRGRRPGGGHHPARGLRRARRAGAPGHRRRRADAVQQAPGARREGGPGKIVAAVNQVLYRERDA